MIEKQEQQPDNKLLFITNDMKNDELRELLSKFAGMICIDCDLKNDNIEIVNKFLQSFTGTLGLGSATTSDVINALDWSQFKGWLQLGSHSTLVLNAISNKLSAFNGGFYLNNQEIAFNALSCSLKLFKGVVSIGNNFSKFTAEQLNKQLPHFSGYLHIAMTRHSKSINWLDISKFKGELRIGDCSDSVNTSIIQKLPTFKGIIPIHNNTRALRALSFPLDLFGGTLDIHLPLSERGMEELKQLLKKFKAMLRFQGDLTKEIMDELELASFSGYFYVANDNATMCLLSTSFLEHYKGSLLLIGDLSKPIIELLNKQLPQYQGTLCFSENLNTDALNLIDLNLFNGEVRLGRSLKNIAKKLADFKGKLTIIDYLTTDNIEHLNQLLPYFKGIFTLRYNNSIPTASALDLSKYSGRLLLDCHSDGVIQVVAKKLDCFEGTLIIENDKIACLLLTHSLKDYTGTLLFKNPVSKDATALLNKQLPYFKGTLVIDGKSLEALNLTKFPGTLQLGCYPDKIVTIVNRKLKTVHCKVSLTDEIPGPDQSRCSLEHFKGTLVADKTLPTDAMSYLNQQLEQFTGVLYLTDTITAKFIDALNSSKFNGELRIAKVFKLLEKLKQTLKPFTGILTVDDSDMPLSELCALVEQSKCFINLNLFTKITVQKLNPPLETIKGGFYIDDTMSIDALEALNLTKFKGTLLLGNLSKTQITVLRSKLEKSNCALYFNRLSTANTISQLPRQCFNRKIIAGDTSNNVTEQLFSKCMEFNVSLYDENGINLLNNKKKILLKEEKQQPIEDKKTPLPVYSIVEEKKEPISKKEKQESKKDKETRKIKERLEQKKLKKIELAKEKIEPIQTKTEPVIEKIEPVKESKKPVTPSSNWLTAIDLNAIKDFVPRDPKDIKPLSFFSKKTQEPPKKTSTITKKAAIFHNLEPSEPYQYFTFTTREKIQHVKSLHYSGKELFAPLKRQVDKKKCPLELSESIDYLMNSSGVIIGNEFDRIFLLGRAIQSIQSILEKEEWKALRGRCSHLDKLRNLLVHYGFNAPIITIIHTIKELHKMTQDPMDFHVDFSKSVCYENLNDFAVLYEANYQYELDLNLFLTNAISLLKLIQAGNLEYHSLENKIATDVTKFSLCYLGELYNHMPLFMKLSPNHSDHAEVIAFLLKCKKQVRNIEFHVSEQKINPLEILSNYAPYEKNELCADLEEELIQAVKNYSSLLDTVEPEIMDNLKKNCPDILQLLEKWIDKKLNNSSITQTGLVKF